MRKVRGVTLLETVMATVLVAVVGLSAMTGVQFATQRQAVVRANQQVVAWMADELANLQSQGQRGILSSSLNVTTTRDLPAVRGAQLRVQTSISAEASNVIVAELTATYNDGQARTVFIRTQVFNNRVPRVIGIKFSPSTLSAPLDGHFIGYFATRNWNRVSSISGTVSGFTDHQGASTTLTLSSSTTNIVDITNNVNLTGATAAGFRFEQLYRGGILPTTASNTVTLSNIPYARYDLYIYTNMPAIGSGEDGVVRLNGGGERRANLSLNLSDAGRQTFVFNRNVVVFSNQTSASVTLTFNGTTLAPPLHGLQIIERN